MINNKTRNLIEDYIARILSLSAPDKPLWNIESIRGGKKPHWNYIDGCMTGALLTLYKAGGEEKYYNFVKEFIDYYLLEDGSIRGYRLEDYNIDNISEGRVLFDLYSKSGEKKYRDAIELLYLQLKTHPRNCYNSFWHKKIYPNQVWLDGLYMGQVFYTLYENRFGGKNNYPDILNQFKNVRKFMFNEQKKLYYHGFDASKSAFWADERGLSKSFWLRSMGWYTAALADVASNFEDREGRQYLMGLLDEALEGIMQYIDGDADMFYQVVDCGGKEGNYLETSGSAMIAYSCIKAAKLGIESKKYADCADMIFNGICKKYLSKGKDGLRLEGICLVAGLGPEDNRRRDGSYEYYISEPVVSDDAKGLGAFIMTYTELIT